jgi:hypothetical protein
VGMGEIIIVKIESGAEFLKNLLEQIEIINLATLNQK